MRLVMEGLTSRWVEDDQNYVGVFRLYLRFFPPQTPFLTMTEGPCEYPLGYDLCPLP